MTVGETMSATSIGTGPSSADSSSGSLNPVMMKTSQEILTSLHLIKDIRRLEKYQRDFFLKVKESLNHVQVLLDHQLMDMAWSDNLTDCEENLLKVSTHLQTTSSVQLVELYNLLIQDREKLSARFQELSVKSSLSEFVVNSRGLLDLHSVRIAAEIILKNEKPLPARGDHSIPVDHTFFLANFCTASLASSMMATLMPKPTSNFVSTATTGTSYSTTQQRATSAYDGKKMNGSLANGTDPVVSEHLRVTQKTGRQLSGVQYSTVNPPPSPRGSTSSVTQSSGIQQNIYDSQNAEKYLVSTTVAGTDSNPDLSNGMYGHELVSAISQIARRDEQQQQLPTQKSVGKSVTSVTTPSGAKMHVDPWGGKDERFGRVASGGGGGVGRFNVPPPTTELSLGNDNSSDEMSSASDDATAEAVALAAVDRSGKPLLSFARIASLNLEKQSSVGHHKQSCSAPQLTLQAAIDRSLVALTPPSHAEAAMPIMSLPPSSNPRYFFDIVMEGRRMGRIIIEVESSLAPKMAVNFHSLVTGDRGFGYRGCQFFQVWKNESVICGDWEHNSGRGGRAALEEGPLFTPDETKMPCIRGAVGMRRMSKKHSTLNEVASQFRIILANMSNQFTGIFGHVVSNLEVIDRVANYGGEGGRPEKIAIVANCGIYKS